MGIENLPDVMTLQELAEFFKISESTIRRAIKDGSLEYLKIGKDYRFEKEEVIRWVKKK